ncbi:MAG: NAD-dependent epimerase/dehydratase family protein [Candidatus Micrarchaeota archaeon]|nr:NAD-dependent epimerase/dehydratase family protein [Candidatus Micrarchaeota archaeon]MDE1834956.1 NAD-dependent epimerase/dehydratase family protein [Candidatus Micrarchaeota archaeon]MDE1859539.1 NAD-dependent epimerase/dehydratase family protein [Candidatus Micrarchaeota archaeon]
MEKVFITGISGFVGKRIAEMAIKQGYEVSGIDRQGAEIPGVKIDKADVRDKEAMIKLTKGIDYVVHVAAVTSNLEFQKHLDFCYDINVSGFNSIIEAAYKNGCKRFVYASSSAVYKDKFSEDAILNIHGQKNHYAKTKMINEMIAASYNDLGVLETVGTRYFNIYGPGENRKGLYASIVSIYINQMLEDGKVTIYGDGKQSRDLIYIDDVAQISLKLLKKGKPGVYNVGTGKSTSYNEIADMISRGRKDYVENPLNTYQLLTKADTKRLLDAIGEYKFKDVKEGVKEMMKAAGL